ncbi:DUF5753 domain-containing protein [Streptomyces sp. NPDC005526]|uniref:DUF5753 domain-containing protein n=1 Tax=Streptomyces sp. NPDC005526 TaxID=3156885 RepID=UPI0033BE1E76
MGRQARLGATDRPELWVVLDEAVLRRPIGGRVLMCEQLDRLLTVAATTHVTVQVLPFDQGGHEAMGGSLTILTLPDGSMAAYTEGSDYGGSSRKRPTSPATRRFTIGCGRQPCPRSCHST